MIRPRSAYGRNNAERAPTIDLTLRRQHSADQVRARLRGASCECHSAGRVPKRCCEAIEELRGERDFRHQDQRSDGLAANIFRHGLEIDLGLARAGDAVDQVRRKSAARHGLAQRIARPRVARP